MSQTAVPYTRAIERSAPPSLVSTRTAREKSTFTSSAPVKSAPRMYALVRLAPRMRARINLAPGSEAFPRYPPPRSASARFASRSCARWRFAPSRSAKVRSNRLRLDPWRFAPRGFGRSSGFDALQVFQASTPALRRSTCAGFSIAGLQSPLNAQHATPGHARRLEPSSVHCVEHLFPSDHGQTDTNRADLLGRNLEDVALEHDEVCQSPLRQDALARFVEGGVGGVGRIGAHRLFDCDLLLRDPSRGVLAIDGAARHGSIDAFERRGRGDEPVAAEGDRRVRADE